MKIVIKRTQKSGMMGKVNFQFYVKGEFDADEIQLINKYKLGGELLVHHEKAPPGEGIVSSVYKIMKDTVLTTNSLINGTTFTCKNVAELLEIEDQVKEASVNLRRYLAAATNFDGEEVIDIDRLATEKT